MSERYPNKLEKEIYELITNEIKDVGYNLSCKGCRVHIAYLLAELVKRRGKDESERILRKKDLT